MGRRDEHGGAGSKLFWTIAMLAVLLVLADRVAALGAERVAGTELRSANGLDQTPSVSIAGFPFLTQFASGRYRQVAATAADVRVGSSSASVRLSRVRVDFRQVTASRDYRHFAAKRATAHATIGYADLGQALGITVAYGGAGRVRATKRFRVLGKTVNPTVSVQPVVVGDTLSFTGLRISGLPGPPALVTDDFASIFGLDIALGKLPFDISVTSLKVDRAGVQLRLSGHDLSYAAPR